MKKYIAICGFLAMAWLGSVAHASDAKTLTRTVDGLVIPGALLPSLLGEKNGKICVLAAHGGELIRVPFQVDELTPDGMAFILPEGPKHNGAESDGVFSQQDEIALMARDTGDRAARELWPAGAKTVEVEVIDPLDGTRAWVYVAAMDEPPIGPDSDYVTWDNDAGEVRTALYVNGYPPGKNAVYFSRVAGVPPRGGSGVDFVDRMKMRFRFESVGGLLSFSGHEDQAGQNVMREKDGPVRVFREGMVYYELPFGISYNAAGTLQIYWESFGHGPVQLKVPRGTTAIVREAMMIATTDFAPTAEGMKFFSDKDPEGVIIDGKMSDKEKGYDPTGLRWSCVTGDHGSLCNRTPTNVPVLPREDAYLEWIDDAAKPDPPEEHAGAMGNMISYFDLSALPPGKLWRSAALFYTPPPNVDAKGVQEYLNIESHPLVLKAEGKVGRSHILPWHPELGEGYHKRYERLEGELEVR